MTRILRETELGNLKGLVVLLLEEGRHSVVAQVALFHLALVSLIVSSQRLVELVRHIVDTSGQSVNGNVRTLLAKLVQLGNSTSGADLTINVGILVVGIWILRIYIDSLLVLCSSTTTIVRDGLDVAQQKEGSGTLVLAGLQSVVGISLGVCSVLNSQELTSEGYQIVGILLVSLVERLHLLVEIGGFATNDFLYGINVGL